MITKGLENSIEEKYYMNVQNISIFAKLDFYQEKYIN